MRREIIIIHRYLAPQRDAIGRLVGERVSRMTDTDGLRLREIADRMPRFVEDLDSTRERAAVGKRMYLFVIGGGHIFTSELYNRVFGRQRWRYTRRGISKGFYAGYPDDCRFSNCASCGI